MTGRGRRHAINSWDKAGQDSTWKLINWPPKLRNFCADCAAALWNRCWIFLLILVRERSAYFFKMLLLRQLLSELDDTLTQCSPIWFVYMVLTDSRSGSDDVTADVITYNHGSLGLNISETRPDSGMVPNESLYKLAYALSIAWSRWRYVTGWRHNDDVIVFP